MFHEIDLKIILQRLIRKDFIMKSLIQLKGLFGREIHFFVDYFRGRDKEELRMILKKFNDEMRNCFIRQQFF